MALDQAILLAGYLLAHSAENLAHVDEVKVLTPISICVRDGKLSAKFHKGRTQAEAVEQAKHELSTNIDKCDAWAFAREGTIMDTLPVKSTLSVSAWASGMTQKLVAIQRFSRSPKFRLLGETIVALDDQVLDGSQKIDMLAKLRTGISQHDVGGPKWDTWHQQ